MDMDIQLKRSRILCVIRALAVICALYALMIASIPTHVRLFLILLISVQCLRWTISHSCISGFVCERKKLSDSTDLSATPDLALKLGNGRWLQVKLSSFYCLWWIQIIEFRSAAERHTLIVLPDSCDSNDRRKIRSLLLSGHLHNQDKKPS